jgi:hypothetical protein
MVIEAKRDRRFQIDWWIAQIVFCKQKTEMQFIKPATLQ